VKVRAVSYPYMLPADGSVAAGPWLFSDGKDLPARLSDWDPATDLHLFRDVVIDEAKLVESAALDSDAEVVLFTTVRSDATGLRVAGRPAKVDLHGEAESRHQISLDVRGSSLGGTITVRTALVWLAGENASGLGPTLAGSELWSHEVRCVLEGDSARFPVSAAPFSELPALDPAAAWTLDWEPSRLEEPVLGAVRLLVNSEHNRVRESVLSGSEGPGADVVRALVHFEVARTLISAALANEEFLDAPESFDEGSTGRAISDLIRLNWEESPSVLAAKMRDYPRQFEMELQSRFPPIPGGDQ
jgi:hypothetical protein